jgi:L-cystine uptake protein TcyP (sodium:dicarboxylate symporter family)
MRTIDAAHGKLQSERTISSAKGSTHLLPGLITGFKARSGALLLPFNVSTTAATAAIPEAINALVFSNQ